ncbi:MAG: DNA internalization-related competence protein ComEC/Rec2 [Deltaproteobacteria bacterium]|nr:DNA internalization-related competence protein ComEC/Rec2 [Deltaproteobacteria bacterium]
MRASVAPAIFFIIGVGIGSERPAISALLAVALLLASRALNVRGWPGGFLALLIAFALAGASLAGVRLRPGDATGIEPGGEAVLEGRVSERLGAQVALDVDALAPSPSAPLEPRHVRAALSGGPDDLLPGERIRILARLFVSRPPANPGEADALERDRDRGVDVHAVLRPGELLRLEPAGLGQRIAQRLRRRFEQLAADAIADPAARALVVTLAVGDRSGLSPDVNEHFNASGLAHILSVSGLHIAVVAFGLVAIVRWLLLRWPRLARRADAGRLAGLLALPAIWGYVALTGSEVPAVRSGIMASVLIAARSLRREPEPFTSLAWAAVLCLAVDPSQLHDLSFQLSFLAVLGLMTLSKPLRERIPVQPPMRGAQGWRSWPSRAREHVLSGAATSLAASLATAPLVAAAFHRESVVAVAANLVALPVASALTAVAALAAALAPIGPVATLLLHVAGPLAKLLIAVADGFGQLPFAQVRVAAPSLSTTLLYYAALAAFALVGLERRALRVGLGAALALGLLGAWRAERPRLDDALTVTFLAVGQGDAAVLRFPGGDTIVIDGGGEVGSHFDPGAQILAPFLWERGVTRLRAVALSHPHPDHALGLIGLGPLVPADELWIASDHEAGGLLEELEHAYAGATLRSLSRGDPLPGLGGARIDVLGPAPRAHFDAVNDQSLVLKVTYGDVSFLFPGDAEAPAEQALLEHPEALASTVVKAPHHGSNTSSTEAFVRATRAHAVVFCVGEGNRFHFPHEVVRERWAEAGCRLFRTDRDGAITFRTDGHGVTAQTFSSGENWSLGAGGG